MIALADILRISTSIVNAEKSLKQLGDDLRVDGIDARQLRMYENAVQALAILKQSVKSMDERGEIIES